MKKLIVPMACIVGLFGILSFAQFSAVESIAEEEFQTQDLKHEY
ncbi:hypothetical protein [Salsuginibacillus kocurii]|nr:hypothetical protein [Salsuginibacillus kocurii]